MSHFLSSLPGFSAATSMFTFIVLIITIIICLSHVCFGHFKYLSAHNYKVTDSHPRLHVMHVSSIHQYFRPALYSAAYTKCMFSVLD